MTPKFKTQYPELPKKKGKIKDKLNDRVQFGGPWFNFICDFFKEGSNSKFLTASFSLAVLVKSTFWSLGLSHFFLLGVLNQIT